MEQLLYYPLLFIATCANMPSNAPTTERFTCEIRFENNISTFTQTDGIVGEWELVGSVMDTNDNMQIDEAERKNLKKPSYQDYMKLNGDGSGLFTIAKMEGKYEAKAKEPNGKKFLTWYDKANGRHRIGTLIAVSKNELHIKEPGGHGLFIWKRL